MNATRVLIFAIIFSLLFAVSAFPERGRDVHSLDLSGHEQQEEIDAQKTCGTTPPDLTEAARVRESLRRFKEKRRDLAERVFGPSDASSLVSPEGSIFINVYFHVIQKDGIAGQNGTGFVPVSMLEEQIHALNTSYSGLDPAGSGHNTPFRFQLAAHDYVVNAAWYGSQRHTPEEVLMKRALRVGGAADLNIYVKSIKKPVLGWASFPWEYAGSPREDGVVILNSTLPGGSNGDYNQGDNAVHEVGHWLGLYHTFEISNDEGECGPTNDEVADTPAEKEPNSGWCRKNTDSCRTLVGSDPIHNFMTRKIDACMYEFTAGQSERMDLFFALYRKPLSGLAYISNINSHNVSVIDTASNTVIATIPVGFGPSGVALNESGTKVYVANSISGSVSVIDTASNTVIQAITVGQSPQGVAVNPSGSRVYVANQLSDTVSVIDTANNTVITNVSTKNSSNPACPISLVVNPAGTRLYVVNSCSTNVSVIDTVSNTIIADIPTILSAWGIAISPDGTRLYLTISGDVDVIDATTNTYLTTINLNTGSGNTHLAINPMGTRIYTSNFHTNNVSVIDLATNTVIETIPVGQFPSGIAVHSTGSRAYVPNWASNSVSVIDTASNTVIQTITVGQAPSAFGQFVQ